MNESLATYIAGLRRLRGLTQVALAERASVSRDVIAQIESGKSKLPVPENRRKLAAALGVRHVDLLVAAGELDADEITSQPQPAYPADEVRVLAERWHQLDADERRMITYVLNSHLKLSGDEGVDNLVQSVDDPRPAFRRSVTG